MTKIPFDYEKYLKGAKAVARSNFLTVVQITPIKNRDKFAIVYDNSGKLALGIRDKTGLHPMHENMYDIFLTAPVWGVSYETHENLSFTVTGFESEWQAEARMKDLDHIKPSSVKIFKCKD